MYIYILLFGWVEFEIILNLEDEKYIRLFKNYSNVNGKTFAHL